MDGVHVGVEVVRLVEGWHEGYRFEEMVQVDDQVAALHLLLDVRLLAGHWWAVDDVDVLSHVVAEPSVLFVVAIATDQVDQFGVEADVVVVHVLRCQFDLVVADDLHRLGDDPTADMAPVAPLRY